MLRDIPVPCPLLYLLLFIAYLFFSLLEPQLYFVFIEYLLHCPGSTAGGVPAPGVCEPQWSPDAVPSWCLCPALAPAPAALGAAGGKRCRARLGGAWGLPPTVLILLERQIKVVRRMGVSHLCWPWAVGTAGGGCPVLHAASGGARDCRAGGGSAWGGGTHRVLWCCTGAGWGQWECGLQVSGAQVMLKPPPGT